MEKVKLTIKEVSDITGYSARQLHYLIRQDKLKAEKVGWIWVIPEEEVIRLQEGGIVNEEEEGDPKVPLKEVAKEFNSDPKELRKMFRDKGIKRPGPFWEWPEDSPELEGIRQLIKDSLEAELAEADHKENLH